MSYLLTEIALEMLGYQFYNADGKPCDISFERGRNLQTKDGSTLEQSLGIKFDTEKWTINEKTKSKSIAGAINPAAELTTNKEISDDVALNDDVTIMCGNSKMKKVTDPNVEHITMVDGEFSLVDVGKTKATKLKTRDNLDEEITDLISNLKYKNSSHYKENTPIGERKVEAILQATTAYHQQEFENLQSELKTLTCLHQRVQKLTLHRQQNLSEDVTNKK